MWSADVAQQIIVKQTKSMISQPEKQRKILRALGLRKIGKTKTHNDNNCIRGMINQVKHLISYEVVSK